MPYCEKCGKKLGEYLVTAFGDPLCEDCWDDYICTPDGKVEYILGIARGDYPAAEFDDDFLREAAASWEQNRALLRAVQPAEIFGRADIKAQVFKKL